MSSSESLNKSATIASKSEFSSSLTLDFVFDSPSLIMYSLSESLSVSWISSSSFVTIIPSSSLIALKTFKISSSDAPVKSIGVSSESMSSSISISPSMSSSSASISMSISSSSEAGISISASTSTSSCSERDSFTNWLISSFIVEASIPFAFSAIASSTFFI